MTFTYMFLDGNTDGTFSIDSGGIIRIAASISRDAGFIYQLSVGAADSRIPPLSGKVVDKCKHALRYISRQV